MHRPFLRAFACLLAVATTTSANAASDRPNVLFIAIDDLNDWVGFLNGHPQVKTPNMDRLVARGMVFTDAHCVAPVCGPSRSAVMTGRQPYHTNFYTNGVKSSDIEKWSKRDAAAVTLPAHFRQNGYRVLGAGKLFHGSPPPNVFHEYGPTNSSGGRSGGPFTVEEFNASEQIPFKLVERPNGLKVVLPQNRMPCDRPYNSGNTFDWGPVDLPDDAFSDGMVANWAVEKIQELGARESEEPFFLGVGHFRPHQPLYAPKRFHDMYPPESVALPDVHSDDLEDVHQVAKDYGLVAATSGRHDTVVEFGQWRHAVSSYLATVSFIDHLIGRVIDALDASPFADNTHIVLWSDHGWHLGEKQHWGKATPWERATHVCLACIPAKAASPAGFISGKRCDRPVSLIDLYPTLIDLCGVSSREKLDGMSLVPLLTNPTDPSRSATVTTFARGNHSVYTKDWHYVHYYDGANELYNRAADPHEWDNLIDEPQHATVIKRLSRLVPQTDDVERYVRSGRWKVVYPKRGSHLGNKPLLFETGFRNWIEERKPEKDYDYVLSSIDRYLADHPPKSRYTTIPDVQLVEMRARLNELGLPTDQLEAWPQVRPSVGLMYRNGTQLYVKLEDWPQDGVVVLPRLNTPLKSMQVVSKAGATDVKIRPLPTEWHVVLPKKPIANAVIALAATSEPYLPIKPQIATPNEAGVFELAAHQAVIHGERLCYEPPPHKNTVGFWVNVDDFPQWYLRVDKPGRFEVEILQGCGKGQGGTEATVEFVPAWPTVAEVSDLPGPNGAVDFVVEDTGHFQNFKWRTLGTVTAQRPDWYVVNVRARRIARKAAMDVRQLRLTPVR